MSNIYNFDGHILMALQVITLIDFSKSSLSKKFKGIVAFFDDWPIF